MRLLFGLLSDFGEDREIYNFLLQDLVVDLLDKKDLNTRLNVLRDTIIYWHKSMSETSEDKDNLLNLQKIVIAVTA